MQVVKNRYDDSHRKELKRLNRKELLEIVLAQLKRIEALESEMNKLNCSLASRRINIKESGSIAEAALKLNGIFEVAQQTCDNYLENVKKNCEDIEKVAKKEMRILRKKMLEETMAKCLKMEENAKKNAEKLETKTKFPKNKKSKGEIKEIKTNNKVKKTSKRTNKNLAQNKEIKI